MLCRSSTNCEPVQPDLSEPGTSAAALPTESSSLQPPTSSKVSVHPRSPVPQNTCSPLPQNTRKRKKKDDVDQQIDDMDTALKKALSSKDDSPQDEWYHFGMSTAARLRNLAPQQRAVARYRMEEILFQAEYGPSPPPRPPQPDTETMSMTELLRLP